MPDYPVLFTKFADVADRRRRPDLAARRSPTQVDYEGELAVVIGRRRAGRRARRRSTHVAGYTIANDVTMRDYQYKTHQWLQGKAWDASTPLGPYLVTPDEVGDLRALDICARR